MIFPQLYFILTVMKPTSTEERSGKAVTNSISVGRVDLSLDHHLGEFPIEGRAFLRAIGFIGR